MDGAIADALVALATRGRRGIDSRAIERFTARQSARVLAAILDRVAAPVPLAEAI
jgi:hypothetical protein